MTDGQMEWAGKKLVERGQVCVDKQSMHRRSG